jgi:hypothetical protein
MLFALQSTVPAEWQELYSLVIAPLAWIPDWHVAMINLAWFGESTFDTTARRIFVLLPMLLVTVGVWATMASLYTLPFRSRRGHVLGALMMSWWDVGRSIWFYWAGVVRLVVVVAGWMWGLLKLGVRMLWALIKGILRAPITFLDWTSRSYFKPGVPWVAFLALVVWCGVEATIFMYTLSPTVSEVLAGITGFEPNPLFLGPILWIFLAFLILGSFACIQVFADAVRNRRYGDMVQMAFVEVFVMFFEVVFLYRELIDAITPWIAQTTNETVQLGLASTLLLACFGWIGVRGMTWFLFGRFGTPAVLAVLSRETILTGEPLPAAPQSPPQQIWREQIKAFKAEADWFKKEGRGIFELLSLPVLQLLAAAVNSIMVVVTAQPAFDLPFKNLNQVMAVTPKWRPGETDTTPLEPATASGPDGGTR